MNKISPLLVFVNPKSGGSLGSYLLDKLTSFDRIYTVRLPDEASSWTNRDRAILFHENLRVVAAGGDGTINWVINMLCNFYCSNPQNNGFRPPLSIIPLGTGNDMSRVLGWGEKITKGKINRIAENINAIRNCTVQSELDVWRIIYKRTDIPDEERISYMVNYFSFGVDAKIQHDFEVCRRDHSGCFCCQCWSYCMYGPISMGSMCCQPRLEDYMRATYVDRDGASKIIPISSCRNTLIINNIPSMMAGVDLWGRDEDRGIGDGLFEVMENGGFFAIAFSKAGIRTQNRISQARGIKIEILEPACFQIDGEGHLCNGPSVFTVEHACKYPVLLSSRAKAISVNTPLNGDRYT